MVKNKVHLSPVIFTFSLALLLRFVLVLVSAYHPDLPNHIDWGNRFWEYGPARFYESSIWSVSWPNQPLGTILLFALLAQINKSIFNFFWFLNTTFSAFPSFIIPVLETRLHVWLVKLPFILSDLGLGYLIYRFLKVHHPQTALVAAAVFLFNPVVIYNSAIWGQTDSLVNLLSLTGLLLIASRHHWGIFLFFLSFLFKLSLIIYLPILLVLLYHHRQEWSKFILPALTFIALALTLAWPFSASRSPVSWLNYLYQTLVLNRQGHMLNGNAFNLWLLIFGVDLSRSEFLPIFQLYTAQQFSRLLFLIINLPLWFRLFKHYSLRHLLTVTLMTAFTAFLVMTNMHERYLYPIFPVLTILVFLPSPLFTLRDLIILSIVHFLNLYNLWFYPTIPILQSLLEGSNFLLPRILSFLLLTLGATYLVKYLLNDPR